MQCSNIFLFQDILNPLIVLDLFKRIVDEVSFVKCVTLEKGAELESI